MTDHIDLIDVAEEVTHLAARYDARVAGAETLSERKRHLAKVAEAERASLLLSAIHAAAAGDHDQAAEIHDLLVSRLPDEDPEPEHIPTQEDSALSDYRPLADLYDQSKAGPDPDDKKEATFNRALTRMSKYDPDTGGCRIEGGVVNLPDGGQLVAVSGCPQQYRHDAGGWVPMDPDYECHVVIERHLLGKFVSVKREHGVTRADLNFPGQGEALVEGDIDFEGITSKVAQARLLHTLNISGPRWEWEIRALWTATSLDGLEDLIERLRKQVARSHPDAHLDHSSVSGGHASASDMKAFLS